MVFLMSTLPHSPRQEKEGPWHPRLSNAKKGTYLRRPTKSRVRTRKFGVCVPSPEHRPHKRLSVGIRDLWASLQQPDPTFLRTKPILPAEMELTSPLTTLGSISTPSSYHRTQDSPFNNAGDDTVLSSPVDDHAQEEQSCTYYSRLPYRETQPIAYELKETCSVHLAEQCCMYPSWSHHTPPHHPATHLTSLPSIRHTCDRYS